MDFRFWNKKEVPASTSPGTTSKKGSRPSDNVNLPQPDRVQMELGTLRQRITEAKDTQNPSWTELYRMYENTLTDPEVSTQRDIAVNKVKAEKFIISKDGTDNDEMTALFMRPWFDKFREFIVDKELWGYRLAEFGQFDADGQFIDCELFPLYNVYPHNKSIILNATDTRGIPYANDDPEKGQIVNPYELFLIELGEKKSLGKLEKLTREVIIKSFARRDWNEHSEKWGQPRIVIKTDAEGTELNKVESGAKNFSRNGYAIVGTEDTVEKFEASNNGSGYLIYDKNIDKCDQYIAKIINGQYGTGAEKAFVGTAQVAENILNDFHHSRLREAQNVINYELIPFLKFWGYPLDGCTGRFPVLDEKAQQDPAEETPIDENSQDPNNDPPKGKKPNARAAIKKKSMNPW